MSERAESTWRDENLTSFKKGRTLTGKMEGRFEGIGEVGGWMGEKIE